jgi:hypothetical protein
MANEIDRINEAALSQSDEYLVLTGPSRTPHV